MFKLLQTLFGLKKSEPKSAAEIANEKAEAIKKVQSDVQNFNSKLQKQNLEMLNKLQQEQKTKKS